MCQNSKKMSIYNQNHKTLWGSHIPTTIICVVMKHEKLTFAKESWKPLPMAFRTRAQKDYKGGKGVCMGGTYISVPKIMEF